MKRITFPIFVLFQNCSLIWVKLLPGMPARVDGIVRMHPGNAHLPFGYIVLLDSHSTFGKIWVYGQTWLKAGTWAVNTVVSAIEKGGKVIGGSKELIWQ